MPLQLPQAAPRDTLGRGDSILEKMMEYNDEKSLPKKYKWGQVPSRDLGYGAGLLGKFLVKKGLERRARRQEEGKWILGEMVTKKGRQRRKNRLLEGKYKKGQALGAMPTELSYKEWKEAQRGKDIDWESMPDEMIEPELHTVEEPDEERIKREIKLLQKKPLKKPELHTVEEPDEERIKREIKLFGRRITQREKDVMKKAAEKFEKKEIESGVRKERIPVTGIIPKEWTQFGSMETDPGINIEQFPLIQAFREGSKGYNISDPLNYVSPMQPVQPRRLNGPSTAEALGDFHHYLKGNI